MATTDRVASFLNWAEGARRISLASGDTDVWFIKQLFADECIVSGSKKKMQ